MHTWIGTVTACRRCSLCLSQIPLALCSHTCQGLPNLRPSARELSLGTGTCCALPRAAERPEVTNPGAAVNQWQARAVPSKLVSSCGILSQPPFYALSQRTPGRMRPTGAHPHTLYWIHSCLYLISPFPYKLLNQLFEPKSSLKVYFWDNPAKDAALFI